LYQRARGSRLALVAFAALVGISFVGLLSHVWADDTLAFIWWGLAGVALAGMGVAIDTLTPEQKKYLASWEMGT